MRHLALATLLLTLSLPAAAQTNTAKLTITPGANVAIISGDWAWELRAKEHQGDRAALGPIDQAVEAYERALKEQPDRLEVYWKLLRALHYKGDYAVQTTAGKQQVFGRGRDVVEAALDRIGRKVGGRKKLDDLPPEQVAKLVKGIPEANAIFLWGGIHWGLWGDVYGRMAAARQGVGEKIRRYGEISVALDERFERAGGHRLLGRLHTLAPKIPFVTGWVDREKAVSHLRRAVALAPEDPYNHLYLADALLLHQPDKAAEAKQILQRILQKKLDPDRVVEDERAQVEARKLLGAR